ncbi:SDR family oxidoreductase [Frankia sp. QA3]|uniref:SDR family oxidoreductase n=1 Tax=Frankia sp. QA3 TaxID=710111 RepID=UPI000269C7D2|nr:SDR family oxidoreductase [Frankia sp. QA3]EIV93635.1 non-ribosomal peptide synthase, dehydrogenase domain-containing protein [Frankia sp. QA3]
MEIAITGATGFLGVHLVRELLERNVSLTVLAHAGSGDAAGRLARFLQVTGASPRLVDDLPRRVSVVDVDVAEPFLGLSQAEFRRVADGVDAIWHSAAQTKLAGDLAELHHVNVDGTRNMLALAAAGGRRPRFYHVSTAFVAGLSPEPVVYEDQLDASRGFASPYERSKYAAEVAVRDWAAGSGRPVVVFRPSVLLSHRPPHPDLPSDTLEAVARFMLTIASMAVEGGLVDAEEPTVQTVRVVGDPRARWNVMAVEDAVRDMVRLAERPPAGTTTTYHIVSSRDLPVSLPIDLLESFLPVRVELVEHAPADPTPLERIIGMVPGFLMYLRHRHIFDDTRTRTALGERVAETLVDRDYLLSGLGIAELDLASDGLLNSELLTRALSAYDPTVQADPAARADADARTYPAARTDPAPRVESTQGWSNR